MYNMLFTLKYISREQFTKFWSFWLYIEFNRRLRKEKHDFYLQMLNIEIVNVYLHQ